MARVCVDSTFFTIDASGNLTFRRESVGLQQLLTFTTPGTFGFTKASFPGLTRLRVRVIGGGGGGAGVNPGVGEAASRAGGGGGGYSESVLNAADLGASETITVGAGGPGGIGNDNGDAGGQSSFAGVVIANGGSGSPPAMTSGTTATFASGGFGAPAGTGQIRVPGGDGGAAIRITAGSAMGGFGGHSGGAYGAGGQQVGTNAVGAIGVGFGGGGGGASSNGGSFNGGAGSGGAVLIELYY